ncbi:MAG: CDP-diacylglycerol--glycerol-3-phosphate 3-phosphatidyltransferase [Christensenellales bacterium]|jgi:CDP-diacylglycerol--glycerol-3-phosphate 3-phosphatidyltransferase
MKWPNRLTLLRIIFIPFFILLFYLDIPGWNYYAAALFVIAFITDILDGLIARRHDYISNFGKLMDPLADKMLVTAALIMLVSKGMFSAVIAVVMISREFVISGIRAFAAAEGVVIPAGNLGKLKTVFQAVAIVAVLLENVLFRDIGIPFDQIMVYASLGLTVWSGADYIIKHRKFLKF